MAKYIIGVIQLVVALAEVVSWYWKKKLLDRREEGLDRKQAALDERAATVDKLQESLAGMPRGYKAEPIKCMAIIGYPEELNEIELAKEKKRRIDDMTLGILRKCKERIEITETATDMVRLRATLWVLERTTE